MCFAILNLLNFFLIKMSGKLNAGMIENLKTTKLQKVQTIKIIIN